MHFNDAKLFKDGQKIFCWFAPWLIWVMQRGIEPTQGRKARPPHALAQCGGIVAKYASGCCSVAPAMQ